MSDFQNLKIRCDKLFYQYEELRTQFAVLQKKYDELKKDDKLLECQNKLEDCDTYLNVNSKRVESLLRELQHARLKFIENQEISENEDEKVGRKIKFNDKRQIKYIENENKGRMIERKKKDPEELSWQLFLKENAGKGLTRAQLSKHYKESKKI